VAIELYQRYAPTLLDSDGLGEVPWTVDVAATEDGDVVGEELKRDDGEEPLQAVHALGDLEDSRGELGRFGVPFVADDDGSPFPRGHLLHCVHRFREGGIPDADHNDGHPLIHKGQGTVLQFSC